MEDIKAYLYILKDDNTMNLHEGYISANQYSWIDHVRFTSDDGYRGHVSNEAGEVYYRKVWLRERDDELAKQLFIAYHGQKIKELKRQLKLHERGIEALKEVDYGNISV